MACSGTACIEVDGPGNNECSVGVGGANTCSHLACVGFTCQPVAGAGANECATETTGPDGKPKPVVGDCIHKECNDAGECVNAPGKQIGPPVCGASAPCPKVSPKPASTAALTSGYPQ